MSYKCVTVVAWTYMYFQLYMIYLQQKSHNWRIIYLFPILNPPLNSLVRHWTSGVFMWETRNFHIFFFFWYQQLQNLNMSLNIVTILIDTIPCRVGSVGSVSASRTVGREFASRPGHTKDHHKNGTNCLPA